MQRKRKTRRSSSVSHGSLWFLHRCGLHACGHHTLMLPNPAPASAAAPPVQPSQAALFQLRRKKSYDYCVLPFGLFLSMKVHVQCAEAMLWRQGIHLATYLDDRLLLAQSQQEVKVHTSVVMVPARSGVCNKPGKITLFFCFCPKNWSPWHQPDRLGWRLSAAVSPAVASSTIAGSVVTGGGVSLSSQTACCCDLDPRTA